MKSSEEAVDIMAVMAEVFKVVDDDASAESLINAKDLICQINTEVVNTGEFDIYGEDFNVLVEIFTAIKDKQMRLEKAWNLFIRTYCRAACEVQIRNVIVQYMPLVAYIINQIENEY